MCEHTKITIITIAYNSEKTIERTIQSIISQNYDNLEYWIIDGESKDKTIDIVESYQKKYKFINFVSEPDNGISDAFNKGIKYSTGELIGIINSDDQLYNNALEIIDENYRRTGSDVIYGNTIVHDVENKLSMLKIASDIEKIKYEMPFIHQSCFIRKKVYEQCGLYSEKYRICMDYDMLQRIYNHKFTFSYTNNVISIFEYGGISCKYPIKTINEDMKIARLYGLSLLDSTVFKIKRVPIAILKLILTRFQLWNALYTLIKK